MQKSQVQLLLNLLQKLYRIKSSFIFRFPVDTGMFPDYRIRISEPIDLSTIIERLLAAEYPTPAAVRDDLLLMISNCRLYNSNVEVLKVADNVAESIDAAWLKFQTSSSQCPVAPLVYCPQTLEQLRIKHAKFMGKDLKSLPAKEEQLEILPSILPPLPIQLFMTEEQKIFQQFPYEQEKYIDKVTRGEFSSLKFSLKMANIQKIYAKNAEKKRRKYRKLLQRALKWLNVTIFMKFIDQQPKNSSALRYLVNLSEDCEIVQQLKLYTLANIFHLSLLWYQHYDFHISEPLQLKFISTCQDAVRCIRRCMKYIIGEVETDGISLEDHLTYFKQRLEEDERGTLKKYLKIQIRRKEENYGLKFAHDEEMTNISKRELEERQEMKDQKEMIKREESSTLHMDKEWIDCGERSERSDRTERDRRGFGRSSRAFSASSMSQQIQDREMMLQRRKDELAEDEMFLHKNYSNYNPKLIRIYAQMLEIDWYSIQTRKLPIQLQIDFQALSLGLNR